MNSARSVKSKVFGIDFQALFFKYDFMHVLSTFDIIYTFARRLRILFAKNMKQLFKNLSRSSSLCNSVCFHRCLLKGSLIKVSKVCHALTCPPGCHLNGFVETHARGHMMCSYTLLVPMNQRVLNKPSKEHNMCPGTSCAQLHELLQIIVVITVRAPCICYLYGRVKCNLT